MNHRADRCTLGRFKRPVDLAISWIDSCTGWTRSSKYKAMSELCGNPAAETGEALMPSELFNPLNLRRLIDLFEEKHKFDRSKICVKCKINPGNLVIRHSVYCRWDTSRVQLIDRLILRGILQRLFHATHNHQISPGVRTSHQPCVYWTSARCAQAIWWSAHSILWWSGPLRPT